MNTEKSNNIEKIRTGFNELFEKSTDEKIGHRAHMLSYIFLSETEKALQKKGWTRKKLADSIGSSASYLTQLFRGDRLLNFKTIAKIEDVLDIEFTIIEKKNYIVDIDALISSFSDDIFINKNFLVDDYLFKNEAYSTAESYELIAATSEFDLKAA